MPDEDGSERGDEEGSAFMMKHCSRLRDASRWQYLILEAYYVVPLGRRVIWAVASDNDVDPKGLGDIALSKSVRERRCLGPLKGSSNEQAIFKRRVFRITSGCNKVNLISGP